jgi:hypothetical protein
MADKLALGARADLFAALNSKQAHDVVVAVSLPELEGEETNGGGNSPGSQQRPVRRRERTARRQLEGKEEAPGRGGSGQQVSHTVSHAEQARLEPGLCASVTSATGGQG